MLSWLSSHCSAHGSRFFCVGEKDEWRIFRRAPTSYNIYIYNTYHIHIHIIYRYIYIYNSIDKQQSNWRCIDVFRTMAFLQEIQPLPKLLGLPWASPSRESWILQGFCCSQLHQQRGRRGNDAKAKGGASRANYAWWFADFGDYIYIYVQWYSPILNVLIGFEQPNIRMGNGRIRWVFKTTCFFFGAMIIQLGPVYQPSARVKWMFLKTFFNWLEVTDSFRSILVQGGTRCWLEKSRNLFSMV